MEQLRRGASSKLQRRDIPAANSPRSYVTPIKQYNEIRSRHTTYQNNAGCLTVLPSHITPPSGLTIVGKNPFEADLTSRLHLSMISPNVFTKVSSTSQQSPGFKWSIDELAQIQPAKIEESAIEQVCSLDPEMELKAQQAIDRFFKENQIVPSPWEVREKDNKPSISMDTPPSRPLDNLNSSKEFPRPKKDAWSQTVLSLPVDLPSNVEDILKSFLTFTQEQSADNDDINSSNSSLRRKLFFNHDECIDNDNESCMSSSSIEMSGSMMLSCSPPQSGMLIHGTLKESLQTKRQSSGSESLSLSYVSPIKSNENEMLYKGLECFPQWDGQPDHTMNMTIENVNAEKKQDSISNHDNDLLDISRDTNDIRCIEDNHKLMTENNDETNLCDATGTETLPRCANLVDDTMHSILFKDRYCNTTKLQIAAEIEKSPVHKSSKQTNTMFGAFNPQNISNSVQDTGYQTYSMNSTTHTGESYNNVSIDHKIHSSEQIVTFRDDTQLSWKENMTNVFSSTPSKCSKEK